MRLAIILAGVLLAGACRTATAPDNVPADAVRVTATVLFYTLEGGFWAVRGDDGTTYDPASGLPAEFQQQNLRVSMIVRIRTDMGGIHMVGPIVDILDIRKL